MKPATFDYHQATSVAHAVELLGEHGDDGKLLAGGQSLAAVMNLRLARPEVVLDIDQVPGLSYIQTDGQALRIGALTRHRQLETYPADLGGYELLRRTARYIGHYPIRVRGTVGGSIAHADPAAEWVLLAALLDAEVELASVRGRRTVAASELFHGSFLTSIEPDELLTETRFPRGYRCGAITEYARRHGDFAIVAAAVAFDLDDDGGTVDPRIGLAGVDAVPVRAYDAERALAGQRPDDPTIAEVVELAVAGLEPPSDAHGDATYRRHLARTLTTRALTEARDGAA